MVFEDRIKGYEAMWSHIGDVVRGEASPLTASILRASVAVAESSTVAAVDKVQAHVEATQAGQTRALVVKSEVYFRDRCRSGGGARLQATLKDGTQLTLGENATLVIDEFVYEPPGLAVSFRLELSKERFYTSGVGSKG
jgi:hypothetical protein